LEFKLKKRLGKNGKCKALSAPGCPAAQTGWKEGDEITAINGQKIGPAYPCSPLSRWAGGPAGTEVTLSLADGSTRKLKLADYL